MLIPKKKVIKKLEGQTRAICVQSVLAKWYCGCLTSLLEMELRKVEKRDKVGKKCVLLDVKKAEVRLIFSTAIRLMAAAREWGPELGVFVRWV